MYHLMSTQNVRGILDGAHSNHLSPVESLVMNNYVPGILCVFSFTYRYNPSEFLHFCSPLYSTEVMDEAMEPFSQSRSMFLLEALLNMGSESTEHTDGALVDTLNTSQSDKHKDTQDLESD